MGLSNTQHPANPKPTLRSDTRTMGWRVQARAWLLGIETEPASAFSNPQSTFAAAYPRVRKGYIFRYRITITNESAPPAKLLTRSWKIIDAAGDLRNVEGSGVVGCTPTFAQGTLFSYCSHCPLETKWGTMEGAFTMQPLDPNHPNSTFCLPISRFFLVTPD